MNNRLMNIAHEMSRKSVSHFRLGSVVARRNRMISSGYNNMRKTHPIMQEQTPNDNFTRGIHAEVHACIGVSAKDLDGSELYVVRILKNGERALAKPCKICQTFLRSVGVSRVWFSIDNTNSGYMEL